MVIFSTFIWICIQIWNCINTRNFDKLYEKLNVMQFLYADKTELYFTLCEGCVFDYLIIQWDNVNLSQDDLDLWLPSSLPVPLTSTFFLRNLFRKPTALFKIIAYSPQNNKVKPLTSLCKILPNDDTEEVVSTDTTSV